MQAFTVVARRIVVVICLIGIVWMILENYSYVFSKTVRGQVLEVQHANQNNAVIAGSGSVARDVMFSSAVLVRTAEGDQYSSSSEDRQMALVHKGDCIELRIYPYPPWDLDKSNTYFNARLLKVFDCPAGLNKTATSASTPNAGATPAAIGATPSAVLPAPSPAASP